ncbi:hypothetical protein [Clostridium pasteurianum]|uniref:Uncharacterized protein n=1 Tax=Clostridium pasteurianum BC1 TaxID=86416 RepID=R4K392_CLOPA|nr:hypothetical protein [Clostridium pasteurianum]AGK97587.1 hypothetical protein Clopa_2747 [Clostridium pasteurianum BC1]
MDWSSIIKFLISVTSISGVIIYLSKSMFSHVLSKDLEKYKKKLESLNKEYEIKFSKLHEERAKVIRDLYYSLVEMESNYKILFELYIEKLIDYSPLNNIKKKIFDNISLFNNQYKKNRIYFNNDICILCDEINVKFNKIKIGDFITCIENRTQIDEYQVKLSKSLLDEDILKLRNKLEDEFRKILGVI